MGWIQELDQELEPVFQVLLSDFLQLCEGLKASTQDIKVLHF